MQPLTRQTTGTNPSTHPVKVLQFGEGNFLRAFTNWIIEKMNQTDVLSSETVIIQPISQGLVHILNQQEGLYHLSLKGLKNGKPTDETELITNVRKGINPYENFREFLAQAENPDLEFIISNTTEAGIAFQPNDKPNDQPPSSFPAKVAVFLRHRYQHFNGAGEKGLIFLPCELIDKNGEKLKQYIIQLAESWSWDQEFINWVNNHCIFCNTLVDRIVPGFPRETIDEVQESLGYSDQLVVVGEQFHLWVIEGPEEVKERFPAHQAELNVVFTSDLAPYRTRKVRILNGAHTLGVPTGYLYGNRTVRENMDDPISGAFLEKAIFDEIIPTLEGEEEDLKQFAKDVMDRFRNPFIKHLLSSIALNSTSKYKTRVLPSLLTYHQITGKVPQRLALGLAALICFYKGEFEGQPTPINDVKEATTFFEDEWKTWKDKKDTVVLVAAVLKHEPFWGQDLTGITGLADVVTNQVDRILAGDLAEIMKELG